MNGLIAVLHDQAVELSYPDSLQNDIRVLFSGHKSADTTLESRIVIRDIGSDRYSIELDSTIQSNLNRDELLNILMEAVARNLISEINSAVALHAGAVHWRDRSIIVAGPSGSGKTSVVAWLTDRSFEYLTDEVVVWTEQTGTITGLPRPLVVKQEAIETILSLEAFSGAHSIRAGSNLVICPPHPCADCLAGRKCGLIIFPRYVAGASLRLDSVSQALAALKLMECNLNARNLVNGGLGAVTALARTVPAIELQYSDVTQLDGVANSFAKLILEHKIDAHGARRLLTALRDPGALDRPAPPVARGGDTSKASAPAPAADMPAATSRKYHKKLTIGMATYDDYDGVYFTLQALRLYHPEILDDTEFLILDNHPDGPCARPLKDLENVVPTFRYVPVADRSGTAVRSHIFEEADSDFVLCIDCHVFIVKNAVKRLIEYFDANPQTNDLIQGPLLYDDLTTIATHFQPEWRAGMYGHWARNPAADDPDMPPFDIPLQGLGLFACRRAIWPGFNPLFRGFGGEEGYIHEKFRRAGGRTLCLPFLRWIHRFTRPMGLPYRNTWEDRLRNYLIGFRELGLETAELEKHFRELLGETVATRIIEDINRELG